MREDIKTARRMWNAYHKQGRLCGMFYSEDLDYVWVSVKGSDMYSWGMWNAVPLCDGKDRVTCKEIENEVKQYGTEDIQH